VPKDTPTYDLRLYGDARKVAQRVDRALLRAWRILLDINDSPDVLKAISIQMDPGIVKGLEEACQDFWVKGEAARKDA
jgi:hypothetical protein